MLPFSSFDFFIIMAIFVVMLGISKLLVKMDIRVHFYPFVINDIISFAGLSYACFRIMGYYMDKAPHEKMADPDDQIKMHGFRIELNEISSVISMYPSISDAVTVALKRNNEVKKIITFVILTQEMSKDELLAQLIPFLEKKLPYYMIPGDIDIVNEFPYSISHKIDKNKLVENYLSRKTTFRKNM